MQGIVPHVRATATEAVASAWRALRGLPATDPWLWLVRPGAPGGYAAKILEMGAFAPWAAAPLGLVLLDGVPRLLVAFGPAEFWMEVIGRG